ncbi:MAG: DCC1-like thiol-disulfide oxidoreductase family protein [Candidatus Marinimicrobia bacterium]|nr:DCC1-like thiol-disulfide oxidoreductase family protein [Candidatus Neomarinimicrobiota bacterium]
MAAANIFASGQWIQAYLGREMNQHKNEKKNRVYWDDACYICSFEVNVLKKQNPDCGIDFVKISDLPEQAPFMQEMIGEFNGKRTSGPDTIRFIYEELGHHKLVKFSRVPVIKQLFDLGYRLFAYGIRPFLPKRKIRP